MPNTFLSGATGDPIKAKWRLAPQTLADVPVNMEASTYRDARLYGLPARLVRDLVEQLAIAAGGAPQGRLPGKLRVVDIPVTAGDLNPDDYGLLLLLANVATRHSVTALGSGVQRWRFALSQATVSALRLSLIEDSDVGPRKRVSDLLSGAFTLAAEVGGNLTAGFRAVAAEYDYFGAVSQTTGAGSTLPVYKRTFGTRGAGTGNWAEDATDADLYTQIVSIVGQTVTIKNKLGAAAAFGSTSQAVTLGVWSEMLDSNSGLRYGKVAETPRIYLPTGATLVALDVFRVLKRRAAWAQSLPVNRPIPAVNSKFILDNVQIRTEGGWDAEIARETIEFRPDVAGRQGGNVRVLGEIASRVNLTRDLADLLVEEALVNAESTHALVIDCESDTIIPGGGVLPYRVLLVQPQSRFEGQTYGVEDGATNLEETAALVGETPDASYSYAGLSFSDAWEVVIWNNISSL